MTDGNEVGQMGEVLYAGPIHYSMSPVSNLKLTFMVNVFMVWHSDNIKVYLSGSVELCYIPPKVKNVCI